MKHKNNQKFTKEIGANTLFTRAKKCKVLQRKKIVSIILAILTVCIVSAGLCGCLDEEIVWEDMVLGEQLPEPPKNKGKIHYNRVDQLWVDINNVSGKQYADYIDACKTNGFTVDGEMGSTSYDAYNNAGYKLQLTHYSEGGKMSIQLDVPMELGDIKWSQTTAAKLLPKPKCTVGKYIDDDDDYLYVYLGDTSKAEYSAYVENCIKKGFSIELYKGEKSYYAKNKKGWKVRVDYLGNSIISISVTAPDEDESSKVPVSSVTEYESKEETSSEKKDSGLLSSDFKTAMDSYEDFMNRYVEFMKKYQENPGDFSLLTDYADYMKEYSEFIEDFEKWEDEEMNAAELAYYIGVQSRVNKKLAEIAY